jgi:pSer/pThr/pTyr-binding forkhead associated (FHA) protein
MTYMLNKLTVRYNGRKIDELIISRNVFTIGRKLDNDLRLEDTTVSSHHAKLLVRNGGLFIEDCGSTNGTLVNGVLIKDKMLANGDVVMIGKYTLINEVIEQEPATVEFDPTLQIGSKELDNLLSRIERAHITHTESSISIDKKTLNWIAQDENGVWWGFENKPVPGIHGWIDALDGTKILLKQEIEQNTNWRDTLQRLS